MEKFKNTVSRAKENGKNAVKSAREKLATVGKGTKMGEVLQQEIKVPTISGIKEKLNNLKTKNQKPEIPQGNNTKKGFSGIPEMEDMGGGVYQPTKESGAKKEEIKPTEQTLRADKLNNVREQIRSAVEFNDMMKNIAFKVNEIYNEKLGKMKQELADIGPKIGELHEKIHYGNASDGEFEELMQQRVALLERAEELKGVIEEAEKNNRTLLKVVEIMNSSEFLRTANPSVNLEAFEKMVGRLFKLEGLEEYVKDALESAKAMVEAYGKEDLKELFNVIESKAIENVRSKGLDEKDFAAQKAS